MILPLEDIYIPPEEDGRIRDPENTKLAVAKRTGSLLRFGQLQPILVQEYDGDHPWKLIDGQIRYISMLALTVRHDLEEDEVIESFEKWGMKPGHIEATTRETVDPITALMMEFHANEDRDDFTWEEKGNYIRRIHDMLSEKHEGEDERWTAEKTAEAIGQSKGTVSQYLQLTDESNPATKSPTIKKAKSFRTAFKQLKIANERKRKKAKAEAVERRVAEVKEKKEGVNFVKAAKVAIHNVDCREWIQEVPDNSLSWFHWDPPYGGKEGAGGAFASQPGIQTDNEYCLELMENMLPEIWRALSDGSWMCMWYSANHHDRVKWLLHGHRFDEDGVCEHCDKHITRDYVWLSENYSCRQSPYSFWTNPYPNIWFKKDRVADGHEIQRFLTKQTEHFFFAGKFDQRAPILMRSDRGNVFEYGMPSNRRHATHKPAPLLEEILSCISVPGSVGGDAGMGSGSIIEAACDSGRKVVGAEISEEYYVECLTVATNKFEEKLFTQEKVERWLT